MSAVKQPFVRKFFLELLIGDLKIARSLRHQAAAVQLISAVTRIDGEASVSCDAHSAFRFKAQLDRARFEHDALQTAFAVFQREIVVPGRIDLVVGEFPSDSDLQEKRRCVKEFFDQAVQFADSIYLILFHLWIPALLRPASQRA